MTFGEYDPTATIGIKEFQSKSQTTVYPNPFIDVSTLKINFPIQFPFSVSIYSVLGEKMQSVTNIHSSIFNLERNGMPDGIYIYYVEDGYRNIIGTGKLIIINQ